MLHTLEDFCTYLYQKSDSAQFYRRYYQLVRLSRDSYRRTCYTPRKIPKKGGGTRLIEEPCPFLKRVQQGILPLFPAQKFLYATAYVPGKSVRDNASPHVGQPLIVKLDLHNFFGSITVPQVFHAIDRTLKASPLVGCHYLNAYDRSCIRNKNYNSVLSAYFTKFCTLDGTLPQGAPTSPLISNLVFAPTDRIIGEYCMKRYIAYTRYSDDLTFSGAFNPLSLIAFVRYVLSSGGYLLNDKKTKILGTGCRRIITGAVVNEKLQAPREYRRKIRQELYYIKKYGLAGHLEHAGAGTDPAKYKNQLLGQIGFVLQLSPESPEFQRYKEQIMAINS